MPDTHVNAFYMDVDEKKKAVESAKAELEASQVRLKDKIAADKAISKAAVPQVSETPTSPEETDTVDKTKSPDAKARRSPRDKTIVQGTARNTAFTSRNQHKNV